MESEDIDIEEKILVPDNNSIVLELGDIIEIVAPTNPELDKVTAIIIYIDDEKIKLLNVVSSKLYQLNIDIDSHFTDESVTELFLLNRSDVKGYARQNNLLPNTWIDIYFGGDVPVIITGEISNLEEDMIEVTTYPELRTIYIDFAYKGIPEILPIDKIIIRQKPASLSKRGSLALSMTESEDFEAPIDTENADIASIEYNDIGESIIHIPETAVPDENIHETLEDLYIESNDIIFGERLENIAQLVEVPESEQRYSIDIQVNDLMDQLLSTIPINQRSKLVLDNIHLIIERFKELREQFSRFDDNENVYAEKTVGPYYKPLIEHIHKLDKRLFWILPIVVNRKKLYDINKDAVSDIDDVTTDKSGNLLASIQSIQEDYYNKKSSDPSNEYQNIEKRLQNLFLPFENPTNENQYLFNTKTNANIDTIVDNLDEFYSTVYSNDEITVAKKQYVIQRYQLGSSKLDRQVLKSGKTVYIKKQLIPNDSITIKSLITLPEPIVRFSKIDLPNTNILERVEYHKQFLLLSRLINKKTDIIPHTIEDISKELDHEQIEKDTNTGFLNGIHEYSLDSELNKELSTSNRGDDNKFKKFLQVVIPKTRTLLKLIRKYIKDKVSFVDIVKELEPFLVYSTDITYKQYLEIRFIINERIAEIKKTFQQRSIDFAAIKNTNYNVTQLDNQIIRSLNEKNEFLDEFLTNYKFDKGRKISSQEMLFKIVSCDNAKLYTNILSSLLISLVTPTPILDALSNSNLDDITELEKIKPTDCNRRFLAKKYTSIRELQKDNNVDEIFYDKEFDDSPYGIIKKYEKEQKSMSPELFTEFLTENLIHKHDCPPNIAAELSNTLINKKKRVSDNEYALLELKPILLSGIDESSLTTEEKESINSEANIKKKLQYYRRIKNNWVRDDTLDTDSFIDNNTLFCNISKECFKNETNNVCETVGDSSTRMREIAKRKMLTEFDKRYNINYDELEADLEKDFIYNQKTLKKSKLLKEVELYKANDLAYEIGNFAKRTDDILRSPYSQLKDLILGQEDFIKRQSDICKFVDKFCRDPMVTELEEDAYWLYCIDTNTKLIPLSIHKLAEAFLIGDYATTLDKLCHEIGLLSDDGDSIVDKYSGYVLRKIDFSGEEGFDESGFRITSHSIMEKDITTIIKEATEKKQRPVFEDETNQIIYNVFTTICEQIDIPVDAIYEFVMRTSSELIQNPKCVLTEQSYNTRALKQEKDNKKKSGGRDRSTSNEYCGLPPL